MTIGERQEEIIEEFSMFQDWMSKYEYIIDLGKELPLIDDEKKTEENIIKGCQSRVWLDANMKRDKIVFTADSDAIITKGLIALMVRVLSKSKPADVVNADLYFVDKIGLKEHLSPTRSNGLLAMIKQMKMYSLAFQAKS
ncbi:MAG: SufE family protein [Flavobacteriales bacterium]|nr:SufE family protein [Flavobacteriales bacterium]